MKTNPQVGYLVENLNDKSGRLAWMVRSMYGFASDLNANFGIKHLLLAPAQQVNVSREFASALNERAVFSHHILTKIVRKEKASNHTQTLQRYSAGLLIVQKVRSCPQPAMILKCRAYDREYFEAFDRFCGSATRDRSSVLSQLDRSFASTIQMVQAFPCLSADFEAMVSIHQGDIYQIDLDRSFRNCATLPNGSMSKACRYTGECVQSLCVQSLQALRIRCHQILLGRSPN